MASAYFKSSNESETNPDGPSSELDPKPSRILIVDEVLAVGDAEFQEACIGKMKDVSKGGRTVLFVSHNMASIKALCQRGLLMDKGMIIYDGDVDECVDRYLSMSVKVSDEGQVPEGASMYNTGQMRFTRIAMVDKEGRNNTKVAFKEDINLEFEVESKENLLIRCFK